MTAVTLYDDLPANVIIRAFMANLRLQNKELLPRMHE